MASGVIASLAAALVLGFVEGMARFYPARRAWLRMRRINGRRAMRRFRERIEAAAESRASRALAGVLLALVAAWIAVSGLLDKRWYEVLLDVLPYGLVSAALLRMRPAMRRVAERMRDYEEDHGDRPDEDWDEGQGGPAELAL
jgi:predicted membrane chloride channel (bestrophin family)